MRILRGEVAGQDEEVRMQARVERADRPERASDGIGAHHRHGGALDHTLHHGTTLAALAAVQAHGNRVAAHHLAQRPARQPERTLGRLHQGTVLAQDHGTGKARATNAARRPAMRSMSTLAPHGAPPLQRVLWGKASKQPTGKDAHFDPVPKCAKAAKGAGSAAPDP